MPVASKAGVCAAEWEEEVAAEGGCAGVGFRLRSLMTGLYSDLNGTELRAVSRKGKDCGDSLVTGHARQLSGPSLDVSFFLQKS